MAFRFNPPPAWPQPPAGWAPPPGWQPDPAWPAPPPGWQLWVPLESAAPVVPPGQHIPYWAPDPRHEVPVQPVPDSFPTQWAGPIPARGSVPAPESTPMSAAEPGSGATSAGGVFARRRRQAEADSEHLRLQMETLTSELEAARQRAAEQEAQTARLTAESVAGQAQYAELTGQLARAQGMDWVQRAAEVERLRAQAVQLEQQHAAARSHWEQEATRADALLAAKAERTAEAVSERLTSARTALEQVLARTAEAEQRLAQVQGQVVHGQRQVVVTEETAMLQEAGVYAYRHPLADAVAYKAALADLTDKLKTMVRNDGAVTSINSWTVNGSAVEGRKMLRDFSKLMLRAYNAEADFAVRSMRPHRVHSLVDRLEKSRATIARLGATMHIRISEPYHRLRVRELELTADYLAKQEEEKERRRELRERQREDEKLQRDIERERARLAKEQAHYRSALQRLRAAAVGGAVDRAAEAQLQEQLSSLDAAMAAVDAREANVRAGYVYVISNIGAFGEHMIKIGLTRRLDPMDRVHELGDASVPFRFDVHALIFSEDAVGLERSLHKEFENHRVNRVNLRREFFYVRPADVREALQRYAGQHLLEFHEEPEAPEWRASGPRGK